MKHFRLIMITLLSPLAASAANLAGGEWFIDGDPGTGTGRAFAIPPTPSAGASVTIPVAIMETLDSGFHLLGIRVKDQLNEWGPVRWRGFHKADPRPTRPLHLSAGEWFIDADPGVGSGTAIPLPVAPYGSASPQVPASALNGLADGYHLLGLRIRDELGHWGSTRLRGFHIDRSPVIPPDIESVEYRIIRDGSEVASADVAASPSGSSVTIPVTHGKAGLLLDAPHLLQVIPIDSTGQRGHAAYASFAYKAYSVAWLEAHFNESERSNLEISGDSADPDQDGLSNQQECLFALNPRDGGDAAQAGATIDPPGTSGNLTLGFRIPAGGSVGSDGIYRTSNLSYTVRQNAELGPWNPVPAAWISGWSLTDVGEGAARLRMDLAPPPAPKRFFHLMGEAN